MYRHITNRAIYLTAFIALTGCHGVPMASEKQDTASKTFKVNTPNKAGIYIYRPSRWGKPSNDTSPYVELDGVKLGMTRPGTFFHVEVSRGAHTVSTESSLGYNEVKINAEAGKNYYFRQYMKPGPAPFAKRGSELESVTESEGKEGILHCEESLALK